VGGGGQRLGSWGCAIPPPNPPAQAAPRLQVKRAKNTNAQRIRPPTIAQEYERPVDKEYGRNTIAKNTIAKNTIAVQGGRHTGREQMSKEPNKKEAAALDRLVFTFAKTMPHNTHYWAIRGKPPENAKDHDTVHHAVTTKGTWEVWRGKRYKVWHPGNGWKYWTIGAGLNRSRLGPDGKETGTP
jgi:plastocyanin